MERNSTMTQPRVQQGQAPKWIKPIAILAIVFGLMTILSGGSVLFGPQAAQKAAGNFVPFVVWTNFLGGFLYVLAGIGLWQMRSWAFGLSAFITLATALAALGFAVLVFLGEGYEMRTVGALILRIGVWGAITVASAHVVRQP